MIHEDDPTTATGGESGGEEVPEADAWEQRLDPTGSTSGRDEQREPLRDDVDQADALEQRQAAARGGADDEPGALPDEADEADVLEQTRGLGDDEDDRR